MKMELDINNFSTIESRDGVQGGQPVFKGRRYRVCDLLYQLARGYPDSIDAISDDFELDREHIMKFVEELANSFENARTKY